MITCSDCSYYEKDRIYCEKDLRQAKNNEYWQENKCLDFNKKESVKIMTRKEAVIYLMDNPRSKLKWVRNTNGEPIDNCIVSLSALGYLYVNGVNLRAYVVDDKSEFEVVRELRKMSFGEAYYVMISSETNLYENLKTIDGKVFNPFEYSLELEDYQGFWTYKGVYEE